MGLVKQLIEEQLPELPVEAYDKFFDLSGPFNPDSRWLASASVEDQKLAVKTWFVTRYCDPAAETPYNNEDGYQYINGGPYDPADEIQDRFEGLVSDEVINDVVSDLYFEVGDEWAPINYESEDYDDRFSLELLDAGDPFKRLQDRINQAVQVLSLEGDSEVQKIAEQLVFGHAITILESFLWETAEYWVENDQSILKNFVTKVPEFRDKKITLGEIYDQYDGLKDHVKGVLQKTTWHNWNKVVPMYRDGLGVEVGDPGVFEGSIIKRHDIVHRSGHNNDGNPVSVSVSDIKILHEKVTEFARRIDKQLFEWSEKKKADF